MTVTSHYDLRSSRRTTNESDTDPSVIDRASNVTGHYSAITDLRIDGTFEGDITCGGMLTIAEGASVKATIHTRDAIVAGTVDGEVHCAEHCEILETARLRGTLFAKTLACQKGARVIGEITAMQPIDDQILAHPFLMSDPL